jgi:hypothetical protein
MLRFETSVVIDRPPGEVLRTPADLPRALHRNPAVRATHKRPEGRPRVGTVSRQSWGVCHAGTVS